MVRSRGRFEWLLLAHPGAADRCVKVTAMTKSSTSVVQWRGRPRVALGPQWGLALLSSLLSLAGCTVELQNRQAAEELAQRSASPGSIYAGWRVFQDRCAGCHGPAATGTAAGPDLLPRVREMGPRAFVARVLERYDWALPGLRPGSGDVAPEELVDAVVQRRQGMLTMPVWHGEPRVSAHIVDLYAYVSARAQGTQGPDRPAP
jgi:mono/diheme cytochrome c family protein